MKKRWLAALVIAYVIVRTYIAALSSYGFYHGWNEGWYSLIARNYFSGSLWGQVAYQGGDLVAAVPPLFSYAVYASFKLFGISDISARLVSIFSEIIAVMGVYILARELYGERTAITSAAVFILIPWNALWFGRAQTDPLMIALLTLAVALYVRAYRNDKSMLPFGLTLGLAVFTKQPALAALPILLIWSYFEGIKKEVVLRALLSFLVGLMPLMIWLSHYLVSGNSAFVSHFAYGELATRSEPFSDAAKVTAVTIFGLSPFVLLASLYGIVKLEHKRKDLLILWLIILGAFVLVRTPPSHEYYSLLLMPAFAILASSGMVRFTDVRPPAKTLIIAVLLLSTIPISYALLFYAGDMGYTATRDAGTYIDDYMEQHPRDTLLVIAPGRYIPQLAWYADLTTSKDSNRQVYGISNELAGVSNEGIKEIAASSGSDVIFLVVDDRSGFIEKINTEYEQVYSSQYITNLPNMAGLYTRETQGAGGFSQKLVVFRLKG